MSRGRPRSTDARRAILSAALEAVQYDGYSELTMEGIAKRANVGKQTLYRWWSTKADIVLDAVLDDATSFVAPEATGDPREDVRRFLVATFRRLKETGPTVRGLMAHAQIDPEFRTAFRERFLARRRAALRAMLEPLPHNTNVDVLVDCIYGATWYRLLDDHAPLDDAFADALVRTILP